MLTILDKRHTSWSFGSFYRSLRRIPSLVSTYGILPQRFASRHSRRRWPSTRMELPKLTRPWSSQGTYTCPLGNGILFRKLFWPTVRKNCSSDLVKLLKFQGWRPRIAKMRSLEWIIWTVHCSVVKGKNTFWNMIIFQLDTWFVQIE